MAKHEGWKNYETWCVALWLDNNELQYRAWRDAAHFVWRHGPVKDRSEHARLALEKSLERALRHQLPDVEKYPSFVADLLGAAFQEVDWHEIADHLLIGADIAGYEPFVRR